jgi:hypothetical protein
MSQRPAEHAMIPVTLDGGGGMLSGMILKVLPLGLMVELDQINFRVGAIFTVQFQIEETMVTERVRSVKHYKDFYRKVSLAKSKANAPVGPAKMLCEFHFNKPLETTRVAITKYLIKHKKTLLIK